MNCPDCGGAMYDNRETKRNPKQPDYKCKDKDCDKAIWLDGKKKDNGASPREKLSLSPKAKLGIRPYMSNAARLLKFAHVTAEETFGKDYDHEDARSLFIQAARDGYITLLSPKPEPKPEPEPEPEPEIAGGFDL